MTFHRASPSCHVTLSCIGACLAHRLAPSSLPVHRYITADGNSMRESGTPESESKVRRCISLSYLIASSGETCFLRLIEMAKPSVSSPPVSASSKDPRRESHDTTLPCDDGVASSPPRLVSLFLSIQAWSAAAAHLSVSSWDKAGEPTGCWARRKPPVQSDHRPSAFSHSLFICTSTILLLLSSSPILLSLLLS